VNWSGTRVMKSPDIVISTRPSGAVKTLHEQHALFVECKIVARGSPSVAAYCRQGVSRFVAGDYAWAMPSAVMIAYSRDGCHPTVELSRYLDRHRKMAVDKFKTRGRLASAPVLGSNPVTEVSVHGRKWKYVGSKKSPGPIKLRHLWLSPV
jgi:hypothetical protein